MLDLYNSHLKYFLAEPHSDRPADRPEEEDDGPGWPPAGSPAGLLLQLPECFLLSPGDFHEDFDLNMT